MKLKFAALALAFALPAAAQVPQAPAQPDARTELQPTAKVTKPSQAAPRTASSKPPAKKAKKAKAKKKTTSTPKPARAPA
ncbi:hypothetical protein BWI17_00870 [Betaproteobacteria bacterium GR16-43]|nr:hypothetical protein BWI17_00870 [Betaproteobacteria bacterium GR16-43]